MAKNQYDGISFPQYTILGNSIYINSIIGGVNLNGNYIKTAKAIKLRFNLASYSSHATRQWELAFLEKMASYINRITKNRILGKRNSSCF
jgi:hypothetical protein